MEIRRLLLVDGYNVLHTDKGLKRLARESLETAREKLLEMIYQYVEATDSRAEVVFDGESRGGTAIKEKVGERLTVTFTGGGQSADTYIESRIFREGSDVEKTAVVVTSDYIQQKLASGKGLLRMSSRELLEEMLEEKESTRESIMGGTLFRVSVSDRVSSDVRAVLKRLRERQQERRKEGNSAQEETGKSPS